MIFFTKQKSLDKTAHFLLKAALFLGPLAFLPFGNFLSLGKQTIFGTLVLLAFAFWLVRVLFAGQFSYQKSTTLLVVVLVVAASVIGFIFHQAKYQALFGESGNFLCLFNILVLSVLFWLLSTRNRHETLHETDTKPATTEAQKRAEAQKGPATTEAQKETETQNVGAGLVPARAQRINQRNFSGIKWFLWGSGVALLFSITQLFGAYFIPADFARSAAFNTVGTINSVAILAGLVLAVCLGMLMASPMSTDERRPPGSSPMSTDEEGGSTPLRGQWWLWALVVIAGFYVLLAGYLPVWYGLIGASFIYFAQGTLMTTDSGQTHGYHGQTHGYHGQTHGSAPTEGNDRPDENVGAHPRVRPAVGILIPVFIIFLVAIVALSMNFVRGQNVLNLSRVFNIQTPLEVSPSQGTSFDIAKKVYDEGPTQKIFGSGWASYSKKWKLYRKQDINWSQFWTLGFSRGASGFTTMLTEGGLLATFLFVLLFLVIFWSGIQQKNWAKVAGSLFMFVLWFFYPFNFTLWLALFVLGASRY